MSKFSDLIESQDIVTIDTFADEVEYQQKAGGSYALTGVQNSGTDLQKSQGIFYEIWAPLANFTLGEPLNGDIVVIDDLRYFVAGNPERDAMGGRRLKLKRTS